MPGITDTQSLRHGVVGDPLSYTMQRDLADDIATQLDLADTARTTAMKRPAPRGGRTTALTINASTIVTVPMTTTFGYPDPEGMINIGGAPTRITVTAAAGPGTYWALGSVQFLYTGWTRFDMGFYRNGVFYAQRTWRAPQDLDPLQFMTLINLPNVGDYVEMYVYREGGSATSGDSFGFGLTKNST